MSKFEQLLEGGVTLHQETVPLRSRESGMIFTI